MKLYQLGSVLVVVRVRPLGGLPGTAGASPFIVLQLSPELVSVFLCARYSPFHWLLFHHHSSTQSDGMQRQAGVCVLFLRILK